MLRASPGSGGRPSPSPLHPGGPGLLVEERAVQLSRLPGRETRGRQHLGGPFREDPLFARQRRCVAFPPEEGANVVMETRRLASQLVGDPTEFLYLIEKRFELLLFDVTKVRPADMSAVGSVRRSRSIARALPERGTRRAPAPTRTWVPNPPSSSPRVAVPSGHSSFWGSSERRRGLPNEASDNRSQAMANAGRSRGVRVYGCSPGCLLVSLLVSVALTILVNVLIRL